MKFEKKKLLTTVSAVALMFAVGACSSSSDDDGITAERDAALSAQKAAETAKEAALAAQAAAEAEATAALAAQMAAEADRDAALAAQMTAEMDAATAVTARMAADTAAEAALAAQMTAEMAAATAETARMEAAAAAATAETARMEAVTAQMTAEQERDDAIKRADDAEAKLADAEEAKDLLEAEKDDDMASDMAKAVHAAIGANTTNDDGSLFVQPPAPTVTLKASSDSVVTATQTGYTMSETYPDEITGWRGVTLEKDGDTTVIYSNIEDAESKEIGNIYGAASGPGEPEHFDVREDTEVTDGLTEHDIPWSVVKRSDSTTTVLDTEDGGTLTSFAGTVSGLAGVFSCTDDDCAVPTIGEEATVLAGATGVWTFVPNDPNGTIDVADLAYVSFGWWLDAIGDGDDYEFDAFASATGMGVARSVAGALEGSATYKGGAAGKYAILSTTDDSATGGHFTATATLSANFDANTDDSDVVANVNDLGVSIGGSITDFMTGAVSRPSWKVTLTGPDTPEATIPEAGATGKTSWDTGGAVKGEGDWRAIFYGGEATSQPTAAIGEFNAAIGGGDIAHISGAFGATKQ